MKTKYLALLIAAMGSSLSFGASIDGLDAAYSKDSTVYDGTSGDALTVSSPTTIGVNNTAHWTMAFTISGLGSTSESNVGLLFTYNTGSYKNLEGLGFQLSESGDLTLCAGGFAYNGGTNSSPWKAQTFSDYSTSKPLTLFYTFNAGNVSISAMLGNAPNGITGEYTLNNFDLYTAVLTEDQMREYALSAVPEPAAASLGLLGLGIFLMRRRRA